ncbi:hypothetical protein Hdeb2414_s0001g00009981 [Helianthus debilis subsp. tardiflorus]
MNLVYIYIYIYISKCSQNPKYFILLILSRHPHFSSLLLHFFFLHLIYTLHLLHNSNHNRQTPQNFSCSLLLLCEIVKGFVVSIFKPIMNLNYNPKKHVSSFSFFRKLQSMLASRNVF